jgi:hypothetical protein
VTGCGTGSKSKYVKRYFVRHCGLSEEERASKPIITDVSGADSAARSLFEVRRAILGLDEGWLMKTDR